MYIGSIIQGCETLGGKKLIPLRNKDIYRFTSETSKWVPMFMKLDYDPVEIIQKCCRPSGPVFQFLKRKEKPQQIYFNLLIGLYFFREDTPWR